MTADRRRAAALVRDERRVAQALAVAEALALGGAGERSAWDGLVARRTAHDALEHLRRRVEDLLETLEAVRDDDDLWTRLAGAAGQPPTADQLRTIRSLSGGDCARLFTAAGYRVPPPPPVDELVDDMLAALDDVARAAAGDLGDGPRADAVRRARSHVAAAVWRLRRQVGAVASGPDRGSGPRLRSAARSALGLARRLAPVVVGVAAGTLVEGALGGLAGGGLGVLVGAAVAGRLADDLGALVVEQALHEPGEAAGSALDRQRAALLAVLLEDPRPSEDDLAEAVRRRAARLADLLEDRGLHDPSVALRHLGEELGRGPGLTAWAVAERTLALVDDADLREADGARPWGTP